MFKSISGQGIQEIQVGRNQQRGQKDENEMYQTSEESALQFNQTRAGSISLLYLLCGFQLPTQ